MKLIGVKSQVYGGAGISINPYSTDWTRSLKRMIRERDNYTCQMCGKILEGQKREDEQSLAVHHIDYNKKNCLPKNLVTLCGSCHSKTGAGNREKWKKFFEEVLKKK